MTEESIHNTPPIPPSEGPRQHPRATPKLKPSEIARQHRRATTRMTETLHAGRGYRSRGLRVISLKPGGKEPLHKNWERGKTPDDVVDRDLESGANLGVVLGTVSAGIVDVDLDEDLMVKIAAHFLPETATFGRPGNPFSHYLFELNEAITHRTYKHPGSETKLAELRGNGHQTRFPPSIHTNDDSSAETLIWHAGLDKLAKISLAKLELHLGWAVGTHYLVSNWYRWDGVRHQIVMDLTGGLLHAGVEPEHIDRLFELVLSFTNYDDPTMVMNAVASTMEKFDRGEPVTGFPTLSETLGDVNVNHLRTCFGAWGDDDREEIQISGNLNKVGDQVIAALEANNDRVYRGITNSIVRVELGIDGQASIRQLSEAALQYEIGTVARIMTPGKPKRVDSSSLLDKPKSDDQPETEKKGPGRPKVPKTTIMTLGVEIAPPRNLVQNVAARADLPFRPLETVSGHPLVVEGRIYDQPGYVESARSIIVLPPGLTIPTFRQTIEEAVAVYDDLLADFPFKSNADRAHAFAFALLPYVRPMIAGATPMHGFDAPTAGSGKGLLAQVLSIGPVGPGGAPTGVVASDDAEIRKAITTAVLAGRKYFGIGNLNGVLESAALAEALTSPEWFDRQLGSNTDLTGQIKLIFFVTGNNLTLSTEIGRRTVRIRIDPNTDRPQERTGFRHPNLAHWAAEHRGDLIHAALTICDHWIRAGCPEGSKTLGSFERWSAVMGGILDVAGIPGFLGNTAELYATADTESSKWRALTEAWLEIFGTEPVTTGDLSRLPVVSEWFTYGRRTPELERQAFAIDVRKQRDRWFGDLRIVDAGLNRNKVQTWQLTHRDGQSRPRDRAREQELLKVVGIDLIRVVSDPFAPPARSESADD